MCHYLEKNNQVDKLTFLVVNNINGGYEMAEFMDKMQKAGIEVDFVNPKGGVILLIYEA